MPTAIAGPKWCFVIPGAAKRFPSLLDIANDLIIAYRMAGENAKLAHLLRDQLPEQIIQFVARADAREQRRVLIAHRLPSQLLWLFQHGGSDRAGIPGVTRLPIVD